MIESTMKTREMTSSILIDADIKPPYNEILTPEALNFIEALHHNFNAER